MYAIQTEILTTLDALAKVNAMIRFHQAQAEVNHDVVMNYQIRRTELLTQLNELLEMYDLHCEFVNN